MTVRFNHVGHCVRDLATARRFYEELLGFEHVLDLAPDGASSAKLLRLPEPVELRAVYLRRDGFVLELLAFGQSGVVDPGRERVMNEPGLTHLSLTVDDVDAVCARVPDFGGAVLDDTRIGSYAVFVRDPDGQLVELLAAAGGFRRQVHGPDEGDAG